MGDPSTYELEAWSATARAVEQPATRAMHAIGDGTRRGARAAGSRLTSLVESHSTLQRATGTLQKATGAVTEAGRRVGASTPDSIGAAAQAAGTWITAAAADTANAASSLARVGLTPDNVVRKHQKRGHAVQELGDLRRLDLRQIDKVKGRSLHLTYPAIAASSGAASGFAITGSELTIPVSGGVSAAPTAAAVAGIVVADAAAVLALASRVVGQISLLYGYDPERPEERVFVLSIINAGTAISGSTKLAAMAEMSQLTQALVRGATWKQLDQAVVAQLYRQFATRFGVRATRQQLGKIVPVLSILIGAGLNWTTLESIVDSADIAYRRRFLLDKYPQLADKDSVDASADYVADNDGEEAISVFGELAAAGGPDLRNSPASYATGPTTADPGPTAEPLDAHRRRLPPHLA